MKKILIRVFIAVIIIAIIVGLVVLIRNATKEKKEITADEFKETMEGEGYSITDTDSQFEEEYIEQYYIATNEEYGFKIEFYVLDSEENAKIFFNNCKSLYDYEEEEEEEENDDEADEAEETEEEEEETEGVTSINKAAYAKYITTSSKKYKVISRIGNTVIYVNTSSSNKKEVKSILNKLGY